MTNTQPTFHFPKFIAHRGGGNLAPENTLSAFHCGSRFGFSGAECDAKLSQDKIAILLHDDSLLRTGNEDIIASTLPIDELTKKNVSFSKPLNYPSSADTCVPRLSRVIEYCLQHHIALNIEIKPTTGNDVETAKLVTEQALSLWQNTDLPLLFSSFSIEALTTVKKNFPNIWRALLIEEWIQDKNGHFDVETVKKLDCVALNIDHKLLTYNRYNELRQAFGTKFKIITWTVNQLERIQELLDWGVDGIITDELAKVEAFYFKHHK